MFLGGDYELELSRGLAGHSVQILAGTDWDRQGGRDLIEVEFDDEAMAEAVAELSGFLDEDEEPN